MNTKTEGRARRKGAAEQDAGKVTLEMVAAAAGVSPSTVSRILTGTAVVAEGKRAAVDEAIARLGFVQADPIRAPARAQDLTLRHRVAGYRAGDLERRYPRLAIEEDFFVNYGFLPRATQAMPRSRPCRMKSAQMRK